MYRQIKLMSSRSKIEVEMDYKVNKQYVRGPESSCAEFDELYDAKLFVQAKADYDASLNVKVIYRIYQYNQLVDEFDPNKTPMSSQESSSEGKGKTATFRPTPLNTTPRPPGSPPKWLHDDDDEDDDQNK